MQMRVEKVQQRIERLLGPNCSLESLRRDVDALGIEKLSGLRKHILASGPIVTDEAMDTSTATSQLLYALFSAPSIGFSGVKGELNLESARESQKSGGNDDEVEGNGDDDEDGDEGEDEDENKSSRRASADASGTWDHEKLFKDWLRKARGLRRLLDAKKPSTACIGNWGIKVCFRMEKEGK
ncbi:Hypothetical Protein FCC1311_105182 [Hondaea fermentalgiana]|uniref:Uncharacterized protein n=1 Tax=Hondaea fermentalgiana TaxID=2315210 RepID=A0A2R5GUQ2_9STRA|nr:Hypothetical Protein FCC1311_105182 [Hondaea fermentalgiana]|eukprot:GBG34295.1 Hypothetical Protein FCC1311_105182 [Hondaea fermentalgiana]